MTKFIVFVIIAITVDDDFDMVYQNQDLLPLSALMNSAKLFPIFIILK